DPGVSMKDGCIKDKYDAKQTLLKSMIAEVSEERSEVRLDFQLSLEVEYAASEVLMGV
ncbi:19453_t:CDS:2, partial [Rhizophagus irregularis]